MITKELIIENLNFLIQLHDRIINETGGEYGIRDHGGLYNSIHRILNYELRHKDKPFSIAAFTLLELGKRHHFFDGNKRTAYAFAKILLITLGYKLNMKYKEATDFITNMVSSGSNIKFKNVEAWISMNTDKIPEDDMERYLKEEGYNLKYD